MTHSTIPVFLGSNIVGRIDGTVFRLEKYERQVFQQYASLNISESVLQYAKEKGAEIIEIKFFHADGEVEIFECGIELYENSQLVFNNRDDLQKCVRIEELRNATLEFV